MLSLFMCKTSFKVSTIIYVLYIHFHSPNVTCHIFNYNTTQSYSDIFKEKKRLIDFKKVINYDRHFKNQKPKTWNEN